MDAKTDVKAITLAVDLDGTLIAADLLWECVFILIRRNMFMAFMIPVWLVLGGKKRLKHEVFSRSDLSASSDSSDCLLPKL